MTCSIDGCGRPHHARGLCGPHHTQARRAGTLTPLPPSTPQDRFWAKVDKDGPVPECRPDLGSCWLWTASLRPGGYGQFAWTATDISRAHRVAYEWEFGPVPDGLVLDHLCRVRHCVRPSHLEAVTNAENLRRGRAAITHCHHGHPYDEANTRRTKLGVRVCRTCKNERQRAWWRANRGRT